MRFRPTLEGAGWLQNALERYRYFNEPPLNTAIDQDIPNAELHFPPREAAPLTVTADLHVTVALDAPPSFTFDVANLAEWLEAGPPARYRVTRESMQEAASLGYPAADVIFILHRFSEELPPAALRQLKTWQEETIYVECEPGVRLRFASAGLVRGLRHRKPFRSRAIPLINGEYVWVSDRQSKALFRYLRQQGYTIDLSKVEEQESESPLPEPKRRPMPLRKLLVLLHTYTYLRRLIPDLVESETEDLEETIVEALLPEELAAVEHLVVAQVRALVENVACGDPEATEELAQWVAARSNLEELAARIQAAIDAEAASLHLTYIDVQARITQRTVRPLDLIKRWGRQYLVAFCEKRQDERHFRLDRIVELGE